MDTVELARVWSASLPAVFDGDVKRWRLWNGRELTEWERSQAFGAFFDARESGESPAQAVQAAYEWLSEHAWPPGKECARDGQLVDRPLYVFE